MKKIHLVGREKEQEILEEALASHEAEMVSVIGRRRVGKTFLITTTYQKELIFEITGIQKAPLKLQLRNFRDKAYANTLRQKASIFRKTTKTKKQIFWTLLTTFGLQSNQHSIGLIDTSLDMDILFEA